MKFSGTVLGIIGLSYTVGIFFAGWLAVAPKDGLLWVVGFVGICVGAIGATLTAIIAKKLEK